MCAKPRESFEGGWVRRRKRREGGKKGGWTFIKKGNPKGKKVRFAYKPAITGGGNLLGGERGN